MFPTSACRVGQIVAQRALGKGLDGVHWSKKKGQKYHGRIAALLTSMQDEGLKLV